VLGRLLVIVLAIGVAAISIASSRGGDSGKPERTPTATATSAPKGALHISFYYSPEKKPLIEPLVKEFNASRATSGGQVVQVEAQSQNSGDTETLVAQGKLQPIVWSPASSLWARLLNFDTDRLLTPESNPSIVRSPLVIAMWEPMARALGWPRKPLGFGDLIALARNRRGWAAYGRPEFGPFRLVHTNPDFSTSGLSAVVAEYYAATGRTEGLTAREVTRSRARTAVRDLERSIVHYGDATPFIADQLHAEGEAYASAVAMEEVTLVQFNRTRGDRDRLVAIYPKEGTFFSDSPFVILDAPWVDAAKRRAAEVFRRWLLAKVGPEEAARVNFRPAHGNPPAGSAISKANGADPAEPRHVLQPPDPRVLDAIKRTWRRDRKPANMLLAVDISDSMNEENRLNRAKAGLQAFVHDSQPQDSIGLLTFADEVHQLVPIAPLPKNRALLERTIDGLVTNGHTALYDAVDESVKRVAATRSKDHIDAVVVLSDGADTTSNIVLNQLLQSLPGGVEARVRVPVFSIAYSPDAAGAKEALDKIAAATGGEVVEGRTENIEDVYRKIASFF
jgi:Ca-activated chloride channel family protein